MPQLRSTETTMPQLIHFAIFCLVVALRHNKSCEAIALQDAFSWPLPGSDTDIAFIIIFFI